MRLSRIAFFLLLLGYSDFGFTQEACDLAFTSSNSDSSLTTAKTDLNRLVQEYNNASDPIGRKLLQKNIESLLAKIRAIEPLFKIDKNNLEKSPSISEKNAAENQARMDEEKHLSLPHTITLIRGEFRTRDVLSEIDPSLSTRVLTAGKADFSSDRNEFHISTTPDLNFVELTMPQHKWLPLLSKKKYFVDLNAKEHQSKNRLLELNNFRTASFNSTKIFTTQDQNHLIITQGRQISFFKLDSTSNSVDINKPTRIIEIPNISQNNAIESLALSDNLAHVSFYAGKRLFLLDLASMKMTEKDYLDAPLLQFSPDGSHLVVFGSGHIKIFDLQHENLDTQSYYYNFSQMGHFDQHILWTKNNHYVAVLAPGAIQSFNVLVYDTHLKREIQFDEHQNFRVKEAKSLSASWNQAQDTLTIASSHANASMISFFKPNTAITNSMQINDGKIKKIKWNSETELELLATQNIDGSGVATINFYEVK